MPVPEGTTDEVLAGFTRLAEAIAASGETVEQFAAGVAKRMNAAQE